MANEAVRLAKRGVPAVHGVGRRRGRGGKMGGYKLDWFVNETMSADDAHGERNM